MESHCYQIKYNNSKLRTIHLSLNKLKNRNSFFLFKISNQRKWEKFAKIFFELKLETIDPSFQI